VFPAGRPFLGPDSSKPAPTLLPTAAQLRFDSMFRFGSKPERPRYTTGNEGVVSRVGSHEGINS